MKLRKQDVLTIPNFISLFRLSLIPFIIWAYCAVKDHYFAIALIFISGISDVVDGFIARRFNMVSDFGKFIDPVADWLTQLSLVICLLFTYKMMWLLFALFIGRQIIMFLMGLYVFSKTDKVNSSRWYGKLNTVVLYGVMVALILFPGMSESLANILIICSEICIVMSLVLYARFYHNILKESKNNSSK